MHRLSCERICSCGRYEVVEPCGHHFSSRRPNVLSGLRTQPRKRRNPSLCSETRKGCVGCLHGNFQLKTRAMRQCCRHRYIIDCIDYSPSYHQWFLSVVVITFALHAKGPGFKPRRNLWITFLLLEFFFFFFFFLQNSSCQKFLSGVSSVFFAGAYFKSDFILFVTFP